MDTIKQDFRLWLATDASLAGLVGINVFFTAIPTRVDGGYIGTRWPILDAIHTTEAGSGHVTVAKCEVNCCWKGPDPVKNYAQASAIAQAVKARMQVNGTWLMGQTIVYQVSVDDLPEGEKAGAAEKDDEFSFHAGASSGIQAVKVSVSFHYWSPNN